MYMYADLHQLVETLHLTEILYLPFIVRIILAVLFSLVGLGGRYLVFACWPSKYLDKVYFEEFVGPRTKYLQKFAWVLGYLLIPGKPIGEGMAYTLPMGLLAVEYEGLGFWLLFTCMLLIPLLLLTFLTGAFFQKLIGSITGLFPWFACLEHIGYGMLFVYATELIARLIGRGDPQSGGLLYFVFHGLILVQIFIVAGKLLHGVLSFILSFFTVAQIKAMTNEIRTARQESQKSSDSGSSGGGGGGSSAKKSTFPETIYIGGERYIRESAGSDTATYYCPKTGDRTVLRDSDLPSFT